MADPVSDPPSTQSENVEPVGDLITPTHPAQSASEGKNLEEGSNSSVPDIPLHVDSASVDNEPLEQPSPGGYVEFSASHGQFNDQPDRENRDTRGISVEIKTGINKGQVVGQWFEAVQRHSGAPLPKEWAAEQLKEYVPAKNEAQLSNILRVNRVIVIPARHAGSGRWTSALHLLSSIPGHQLTIRRIRRESGEKFSMDGLRGRRNNGWILDLRDPDESMSASADLGHELLSTRNLTADDSFLVVLAGTELWSRIGIGSEHITRELEPPDPLELFSAFLSSSAVTDYSVWAEQFKPEYISLRPGQIQAFAHTLIDSYLQYREKYGRAPSPDVAEEFAEVKQTVDNAFSGWMEELAKWHEATDRTSYDRNYLLLASVYNGEPIDTLHSKIASLAQALGERGDSVGTFTGQQGPGLIQLTRKINADLLPDGSVRFPGPGFAEAVVRYFWLDRPNLTDAFTKWTVQLSLELKHPKGSQLAARLAPWVLHHAQATGSTRLLRLVVSNWSEDEKLADHAHNLLVLASLDQEIGSRVRRAISLWVGQDGTSPALLRTLARVFGTLTPAHPQMLGRLSELTGSTKEGVTDAVGIAINDLWRNDDVRLRLREILISWLKAEDEVLRETAANAFLHLAAERDVDGQPVILRELRGSDSDWAVLGWRAALETEEPNQITDDAFILWLNTQHHLLKGEARFDRAVAWYFGGFWRRRGTPGRRWVSKPRLSQESLMQSCLPSAAAAIWSGESPEAGTPAGTIVVRAADLRVHGMTVTAGDGVPPAGELTVFCRPVITAPAVTRRDGTVLADAWLPDLVRLGGLEAHLGDGVIEAIVDTTVAAGRLKPRQRRRIMSYPLVIRLMIAMTLMPDASYCEALARLAGLLAGIPFVLEWHVPTEKVVTDWRLLIPADVMEDLFWQAAGPLIGDDEPSAVMLAGMPVAAADGMLVNVADTPANRAFFGSTGTADDSSPFPQLRIIAVTARAGRAMLGAIPGQAGTGEQTLLKRLVKRRPGLFAGRAVCFDRNFPGHDLITAILDAGGHVVARVKEGISLPFEDGPGRGWLPDGSRMTWLNAPSGKKAGRLPVRAAEHNVTMPGADGDGDEQVSETCTIITTLLDHHAAPADEVRDAYLTRWSAAETTFGEDKSTIAGAGNRTSGPVLRSGSPRMVIQEAWAWLAGTQLVRASEAAALRSEHAAGRALRRRNQALITADEESFTAARHHAVRSMTSTQVTATSTLDALAASADSAARACLHTLSLPGRQRHSGRAQKARPKFPHATATKTTITGKPQVTVFAPGFC